MAIPRTVGCLLLYSFIGNNYGEVCVFCHTPHGANTSTTQAPLWNHTINTVSYTTWDTQAGTTWSPGPNSLICLGCHDGSVSLDSIVNMPGSGKYNANNADGTGLESFLDLWNSTNHWDLATCQVACHITESPIDTIANEIAGKAKYFGPADSKLNKNDIRIYASGSDFKVECTSCHDPHGVPSAGPGSEFIGSFLRVDNTGSTLCLTCHDK